ncbi:hypothetical protein F2Q68_00043098 [Brassica cretica]|uniref:Uncharacterized protein n=1 Tax=Brassica cretica TaxID=69181 RepID=A0A8S9LTN1_BRACR|nr:hypothetical protein F2Q68_00043098 [Brassica cretica]
MSSCFFTNRLWFYGARDIDHNRSFGSRRWLGAAMAISMIEFRSAGEASGIGLLGLIKVKRKSRRRRGVRTLEDDQNRSDDAIDRRVKSPKVPQELLSVLKEMRRGLVCFWNIEHKRDAVKVVERRTRIQKSQLMLDLTAAMPREKSDQSLSLQPLQPVTKFVKLWGSDISAREDSCLCAAGDYQRSLASPIKLSLASQMSKTKTFGRNSDKGLRIDVEEELRRASSSVREMVPHCRLLQALIQAPKGTEENRGHDQYGVSSRSTHGHRPQTFELLERPRLSLSLFLCLNKTLLSFL